MIDLTDSFKGSDTRLKIKGSKLTRLDILLEKVETLKNSLNENSKIVTTVYDKEEFVERLTGSFSDTKEILEYYSPNFVIDIKMKKSSNEIIVYLLRPVEKSADADLMEQYKKNQD